MRDDHRAEFVEWVRESGTDALILAGDIGESDCVCAYLRELHDSLEVPIYFVLGNHDFYYGEIAAVRSAVGELTSQCPRLHWLPQSGVVPLDAATALIGHEGWGDGRCGDYAGCKVFPQDIHRIKDFAGLSKEQRLGVLHRLGDEAAEYLREALQRSLAGYAHVYLVTHVPPFWEACIDSDLRVCGDHKLPFYTCKAVGDVLLGVMKDHPQRRLTVLCGHTHWECSVRILDNLHVVARNAGYGSWFTPSMVEIS
jgi:hypothetical protein